MWLVRLALSRPYTFIVIAILLLLLGVLSILRTPTDIFPAINIPVVSVVWSYSGMPPDEMADRVTTVFELALTTTVNNIEHIESQSLLGVCVMKIFFHPGTDVGLAIAQVTAIAQTLLKYLPPGITPPFVLKFDASTVAVMDLVLSSATLAEQKLNDLANNFVRPQLATVQGASVPPGYGGKSRQVMVDLNTKAMQQFGVSAQNVNSVVNLQSLIIPAGTEKIGPYEYIVKVNNSPPKVDEFNLFPVIASNNTVISLQEIAHVRDGFPPQTNIINLNSTRAVMLGVEKTGGASTLTIIQRVIALLPHIKDSLTKALHLDVINNQAIFITSAIQGVVAEGVTAACLTALMILLFLGSVRSTFMVTISIPLAILTSIIALSMLGETINIMTLGGLALAVGILVDDATVTIENINYNLEEGKPVMQAILDGANQVAIPAIVSTLCICIVFLPMFFLTGISKYLFIPLAEAVIFAMLASYFLSRTLLPTMAHYLLKPAEKSTQVIASRNIFVRVQKTFEMRFTRLQARYHKTLADGLEHQGRLILIFSGIVLFSLALLWPNLGADFFPKVDAGEILLHYSAPAGTRIEETARIAAEVNQLVREVIPPRELHSIMDNIGLPISGVNLAYNNSGTNGANDTDTLISLEPDHHPIAGYINTLRRLLHERFSGVNFSFLAADIVSQTLNFGQSSDIDVQISGLNAKDNYVYTQHFLEKVQRIPGIVDARIRQSQHYPVIKVTNNRTRAKELGFTQQDIGNTLLISLAGAFQTTPNFWIDPTNNMSYQITTQTPQYGIDTVQDLLNTPITNTTISSPPQILGALASVEYSGTPQVVSHYNVQPVFDVYAGVSGRDLASVGGDLQRVIDDTKAELPQGSQLIVRGILATQQTTFSTLYMGLILSIVFIYMLIVINFQSWLDPFIIILALPVALAGIACLLFLTHTRLSVPALTGAIMAMGVATSNSILMVSFARDNLSAGLTPKMAALTAATTRLRPVLMTAIAMILGMLPMSLGLGAGGEQNAPLGRAVIGGLLLATNATLFLVPTLFCFFHSRRMKQQGVLHA